MASDYGLNFGFRRSDESMSVREGRFRTPKTGDAILLGSAVVLDASSEGYLKKAASNAEAVTGAAGLLVQEDDFIGSIFEAAPLLGHDSLDLGEAKLDLLSTMWSGAGVKVWFRNTSAYSRHGRTKDAVTIVDTANVTVGSGLGWDGDKWVHVDGSTVTKSWMTVTQVSTDYCEAVLTF